MNGRYLVVHEVGAKDICKVEKSFVFGVVNGRGGDIGSYPANFLELSRRRAFMADTYNHPLSVTVWESIDRKIRGPTRDAMLAQTHAASCSTSGNWCARDTRMGR